MDIRLILDSGASPQAPPGKLTEPPPRPEEFEKTLQTAQKEETPGEVAENEPNAQLQTLDSEKKETGTKKPDSERVIPIGIDPTIFAQLQIIGISKEIPHVDVARAISGQDQVKVLISDPTKLDVLKLAASSTPTASVNIAAEKLSAQGPTPEVKGSTPKLTIDSKELSAIIATTFDGKILRKLGDVQSVAPKSNVDVMTPEMEKVDLKVNQLVSSEMKPALNVTSVQSKSSLPEAQPERIIAPGIQIQAPTENPKSTKQISISANSAVVEDAGQFVDNMQAGQEKEHDSSDKQNDHSQSSLPENQVSAPTSESVQTTPSTPQQPMTSVERQAMVDSISRKIDELASKSVRNEVRVEMHPPELGSVVVNIRKDMAGLTATLNASNEPLRQALHESRNDLAGALSDRNVGQVRIEVRGASSDTMNMGQQFNQAHSHHQNPQHQTRHSQKNSEFRNQNSNDLVEEPAPRRAKTTLLDLEI